MKIPIQLSEEVRGMVEHKTTPYWDWHFPFYHKSRTYLIVFTKSGIYQVYFDKPMTQIVKTKKARKKKFDKFLEDYINSVPVTTTHPLVDHFRKLKKKGKKGT